MNLFLSRIDLPSDIFCVNLSNKEVLWYLLSKNEEKCVIVLTNSVLICGGCIEPYVIVLYFQNIHMLDNKRYKRTGRTIYINEKNHSGKLMMISKRRDTFFKCVCVLAWFWVAVIVWYRITDQELTLADIVELKIKVRCL